MPILDPTSFTTPREKLELLAYMGTQKRVQSRGTVRKYVAKALTDSIPLSLANLMSGQFEVSPSSKVSRYILRAKIQSVLYNHKDPHAMLPDPCLPIYASKPNEAIALIKLHSLCITPKGFDLSDSEQINKGDIIEISCKIDRQTGQPMVALATVTKIIQRAPPITASDAQPCIDLSGKFDYASVSLGDSGADRAKRQVKIDSLWAAVIAHGNVPKGVSITSTGRTVAEGRAMIVRMAKSRSIAVKGTGLDNAENERLRAILTDRGGLYKLAIAKPSRSSHCVGEGCRYGNIIAFDVSGGEGSSGTEAEKIAALEAIGSALQKFKDDTGPTGYAALIAAGTIESFANTSFAPGGWVLEAPPKYNNNAVHVEIVGS